MKKYIFIAILILAAFNAQSQKLEKPIIDKMTGDTILATKEQVLAEDKFSLAGHYLACYIVKGKGFCSLHVHIKDGLDINYYVDKGDKAIIKFSDGKVLDITAAEDAYSSLVVEASPDVTECSMYYDLTDDNIAALKNGKIAVIRLITSMGPFDYTINEKKSDIIKKHLELTEKNGPVTK